MLAPQSKNKHLFSGIISQSGSPVKDAGLIFNKKGSKRINAVKIAKVIGCRTNTEQVIRPRTFHTKR